MTDQRPPRDNLVRALRPGPELRSAGDGAMPTMTGEFAVFNQWTRIDSIWEGTFMERLLPGSFKKTIAENGASVRVTLNHGGDPQAGDKPLGPIDVMREQDSGVYYEVPLLDTSYNRDILPGLQAGLYGASFRFQVMKEEFDQAPKKSVYNPEGIPERSISEVRLMEFGPVTFPAYVGASAGVRSMTDEYLIERLNEDPERFARLLARSPLSLESLHPHPEPPTEPPNEADARADEDPPDGGSSDSSPALPDDGAGSTTPPRGAARPRKFQTREDYLEWISRT